MPELRQNDDGSWSPDKPIKPSRIVRLESWLIRHRIKRLARWLADWDERGLGR